jgi:glyoxylase-like metal-dependent hydrolase (beta-lactamase superfamily II)
MPHSICTTCGTQFAETAEPPDGCAICLDERQYVGHQGQHWTTLERLRQSHWQSIRRVDERLMGIGVAPAFAIGQRALLIQSPAGNILWDCVALLDSSLIELLAGLGGLAAIAISHPHYYTTMVDWARAFNCPVYLHAADRRWVMRPDEAIQFWEGETKALGDGITLVRCGGHFEGGTVLHWRDGAHGAGALLTGDIIQVAQARSRVSFMYSYPNLIPLSAASVQRIVDAVEPFAFDCIHGAFWDWTVVQDAKQAVHRSAARYRLALQ